MKIVATVSEFNPFHKGHKYLIETSKKRLSSLHGDENIFFVSIMSGNFVQRGEPAIWDKKTRAETAALCGIDLVLELPAPYSFCSAEYFSKGAINLIHSLSCVDYIAFGCENGDDLVLLAEFLSKETRQYRTELKSHLAQGKSFAKARELVIGKMLGKKYAELIKSSNNILGIEYLKCLKNLKSKIKPLLIERNNNFKEATFIREQIGKGMQIERFIPYKNVGNKAVFFSDFTDLLFFEILRLGKDGIKNIFECKEGLENLIYKTLIKNKDVDFHSFVGLLTSTRYSSSQIKRLLLNILLNVTKETAEKILAGNEIYSTVLGFNENGQKILKLIKDTGSIKIIKNIKNERYVPSGIETIASLNRNVEMLYEMVTGVSR